ncbi:LysR family transcriptional regulator ArgP [Microbacterium yannicii]|uniref:LysR family transcriptional regulator ArgP n=1 Tax=Microbacterium yannicii TaxID=671622 RepID=A0ABP9M1D6_9MICO|nr:LysR family transcriptional regulator ArgP [Microbacterium yannicii]MCO5954798.1 LysR family transcriptional regulator ArgP [Microbacterium yannicii]
MRIPFELAETLAVVVDEGTLDAAARRLHVTPSAVSQRIKALEEQLGRLVLVRSKPVRATEAGASVIRLARQLALLEHDALAELGADDGETALTSVPLAVNADSLATWFLAPIADLARRHPVVFDLHRDDQDFTAGLLESGTVMGAVTSRQAPVAGCRSSALGAMRYEAVATAGYVARWLTGERTEDLSNAPLVDFDRRDDLQNAWLARQGVDPARPPRHYVPASNDFAAAVRLGLGWAMLPRFQSHDALERGELVLLGGPPVDVALHWQQWNLRSPLLDAIADAVVTEGRRVLAPV